VAIRGIQGRATQTEVEEVWGWVQQALSLYGVGSRTASGYGSIQTDNAPPPILDPGCAIKTFEFSLKSQGCAGPDMRTMELRPSHWRGWLRSWMLRFLLGVMSQSDAKTTVGELLGTLEPESRKGCVRLQMVKGETWGDHSDNQPTFYLWKGQLQITAPSEILNKIILPVVRFAVMVGGVGRGWRRPLHIFWMKKRNGREEKASRGTYLTLTHEVNSEVKSFGLPPQPESWNKIYQKWQKDVQNQWSQRFAPSNNRFKAEVFSPETCAVYLVPGPEKEPVDRQRQKLGWKDIDAQETRGSGMDLIYSPTYKRQPDVGGQAGGGGAYCSWVSIKRIPVKQEGTKEIVCLFMGDANSLRSQFLANLAKRSGAVHLFGVQPPDPN
jgi:CRISPR-associated protein Cmr6